MFALLPAVNKSSCCSPVLPALGVANVSDFSHSDSSVMIFTYSLSLHFPDDIAIWVSSLMRNVFRSFAHSVIRL